jgi:hypothetical protein
MADRLMLLPSANPARIRLVRVPRDLAPAEAYRLVTGLIAGLESVGGTGGRPEPQGDGQVPVDEVVDALEDRGFENLDLILGPSLD